jgi:PAS domain S-box-containing protein
MTSTPNKESKYVRSLIEASLDPLVTISITGKITDVNEALVKVTGISRAGLIGTDFSTYFTSPIKAQEGYLQVFEKSFVSDYALTIKHKNGTLTDVLYNASLYKDEKGKVLGVFAAARDVTEQSWSIELRAANKELAFQNAENEKRAIELSHTIEELAFQNDEKEKRAAELVLANIELVYQTSEKEKRAAELVIADIELAFQNKEKEKREIANKELELLSYSAKLASQYSRSLIEASHDPLVTISIKGKITDMNQATVNITGLTREKLTGTDFFDYFTEIQKAREVYQEVFARGSVTDSPLTLRHKDGKLTDVLFNGSVYKDDNNNVQGVVIVARDVTEQKRIARELLEAKEAAELATTIAEEAKTKAEEVAKIAENAVKSKQQFLSNMSHEIRTPMNAIIGFTKVMLKTELTAKQKEYLTAVKMSGNSLIVLINDILDLAKVDAGKMTFEKTPFKIASSLTSMLHLFETKIQEKNLSLIKRYDNDIPEVLLGDPARLHQIILNLVSNAVKFTTVGHIIFSVRMLSETKESVSIEFSISDTGIGIKDDKIDQIFDNFQQATNETNRVYGGTGLGLAIVKQLVEGQGGSISVKSVIDVGTTFSFILNFQQTDQEALLDAEFVKLDDEIKNIKVLVVEDIMLNQLLMKTLLDDFGFERDIASNGLIAIEKLKEKSYDIILMDLQMPEMNGFEATRYIRNTMLSDIPIIALTADVTTVDIAKCRAAGMDDYIAKPVDEKILYSKIVHLVTKSEPIIKTDSEEKADVYTTINLTYLKQISKSNPKIMMEMITLYLEQTPPLLALMKESFNTKDWVSLKAVMHKMISSFTIVGINADYTNIAKKLQQYAEATVEKDEMRDWVLQIDNICNQACAELKVEYELIKKG